MARFSRRFSMYLSSGRPPRKTAAWQVITDSAPRSSRA